MLIFMGRHKLYHFFTPHLSFPIFPIRPLFFINNFTFLSSLLVSNKDRSLETYYYMKPLLLPNLHFPQYDHISFLDLSIDKPINLLNITNLFFNHSVGKSFPHFGLADTMVSKPWISPNNLNVESEGSLTSFKLTILPS